MFRGFAASFLRCQHFKFLLFCALDSSFSHFRVGGYLAIRERTVEEKDVYAKQENCQAHKDKCCKEGFHFLQGEFGGNGLIIIYAEYHPGESFGQ